MSKTDKLLAVLELTGEEQEERLCSMVYYPPKDEHDMREWSDWWRETKADLAFRLRDEAAIEKDLDWDDALTLVWEKLGRSTKYQIFCRYYAQPIHWIIAALIAKELAEEKG